MMTSLTTTHSGEKGKRSTQSSVSMRRSCLLILSSASSWTSPPSIPTLESGELSKAVLRMSEGEYSEMLVQEKSGKISPQEYIKIIEQKTAALFQSSAKLGAIIAGGKQQMIESLADFGLNLGIAYQVQDDLLDWEQKASLERALGAERATLESMSHEYALSAKSSLVHLVDSDAKDRLMELAEFAVRRRF